MTRRISEYEFERRQMMSSAQIIMTEAQLKVTETVGELYVSEWIKLLNDMQRRMIDLQLKGDWKDGDHE